MFVILIVIITIIKTTITVITTEISNVFFVKLNVSIRICTLFIKVYIFIATVNIFGGVISK